MAGAPKIVDGSNSIAAAIVDPPWWDEAEYRQEVVARALEVLRSEFQASTWQAFWESTANGRSGREVAAELGLSCNAVYLARSRVLRRVREELEGLLD
jgi:RNA polymerase sigma-70 factor (ECF subfamily)